MYSHCTPHDRQFRNLLSLLDKLVSHPNGLELARLMCQLHLAQASSQPQSTPETADRTRLIAIAMHVVKSQVFGSDTTCSSYKQPLKLKQNRRSLYSE